MLHHILAHTPLYVWALLAFLVYRGCLASRDREVSLRALFVLPAVMLYLSVSGMQHTFGGGAAVWACWLAGAGAGAVLAWRMTGAAIAVDRAQGMVVQRGSWAPLALMMGIFATRYTVAVLLTIDPAAAHGGAVAVATCAVYGLFNGIFAGRLARYLSAWLRQPVSVAA
ncbi:hypothetical protein ASF61_05125 [Duganella sp. Leaf126]|nr:hypothetical protein ASF61_05125 [Duganella sp. Leaf126]